MPEGYTGDAGGAGDARDAGDAAEGPRALDRRAGGRAPGPPRAHAVARGCAQVRTLLL